MNNLLIVQLAVQCIASVALLWSSACRLQKTNEETIDEVRNSIWFLGLCSVLVLLAPYLPAIDPTMFTWEHYQTPTWVWLELLISLCCIQVSTARHWLNGVPRSYTKDAFHHERRRNNVKVLAFDNSWANYDSTVHASRRRHAG